MHRFVCSDSLQLEDFDIINMKEWFPERIIGVSVNQIYIQIAKYNGNASKRQELQILSKHLATFDKEEYMLEPKYVTMSIREVEQCFGSQLKKLPKKTFINIENICDENDKVYEYAISK